MAANLTGLEEPVAELEVLAMAAATRPVLDETVAGLEVGHG